MLVDKPVAKELSFEAIDQYLISVITPINFYCKSDIYLCKNEWILFQAQNAQQILRRFVSVRHI